MKLKKGSKFSLSELLQLDLADHFHAVVRVLLRLSISYLHEILGLLPLNGPHYKRTVKQVVLLLTTGFGNKKTSVASGPQ
jgi:hypothetical protein